jgi:hypothetical protein
VTRAARLILALAALAAMTAMTAPAVAQQLPMAVAPPGEKMAPQPRLELPETSFQAGQVQPGGLVTHEFELKNEGDAPLIINQIQAGCSCLVTTPDQAAIEPGATGRVTVSLSVFREWAGRRVSRAVWLLTNDPLAPQARLLITAQVLPLAEEAAQLE